MISNLILGAVSVATLIADRQVLPALLCAGVVLLFVAGRLTWGLRQQRRQAPTRVGTRRPVPHNSRCTVRRDDSTWR